MTTAERIVTEAFTWVGTPFGAHQACKGAAVDCVHLVGSVMVAAGVVTGYSFPPYSMDYSQHWDRSLIDEYLNSVPAMQRVENGEAGDIVTFRIGRCVHHCGILVDSKRFVHAALGRKVGFGQLDDSTWSQRVDGFWRAKL